MAERTFLIQRYCSENWPLVRGERPFIASGPRFLEWITPDSLERRGRHVLRPQVKRTLSDLFPGGGMHRRLYQHQAIAESMLREGVLCALWSVDSAECLPVELRWEASVDQVARELPFKTASRVGDEVQFHFWDLADSVEELLSGMQSPAMARQYVSEDRLSLEPVPVP